MAYVSKKLLLRIENELWHSPQDALFHRVVFVLFEHHVVVERTFQSEHPNIVHHVENCLLPPTISQMSGSECVKREMFCVELLF